MTQLINNTYTYQRTIKTKHIVVKLNTYIDSSKEIDNKDPKFKLTVCSYHVTYAFQSKSTLYCCLNVKELLARNRREI